MWVFAILALVVGVLFIVVVAMLMGPLVGTIYDIVISDPEVQAMGFDVGVEVAMRIGGLILPLLGLSAAIWFFVLRLQRDQYLGQTRSRR